MLRYTILSDNTLQFSISGDYKIIAMANYKKNERKFYTTLFLARSDISTWNNIMELSAYDIKHPKTELARIVTEMYHSRKFDKYIEQFEYEQKCFDYGNDFYENERLKYQTEDVNCYEL